MKTWQAERLNTPASPDSPVTSASSYAGWSRDFPPDDRLYYLLVKDAHDALFSPEHWKRITFRSPNWCGKEAKGVTVRSILQMRQHPQYR